MHTEFDPPKDDPRARVVSNAGNGPLNTEGDPPSKEAGDPCVNSWQVVKRPVGVWIRKANGSPHFRMGVDGC